VVEFNLRSQFNLLSRLGLESPQWQHLGWAFAIGLTLWIAWVAISLRRSVARLKPDRVARAWLRATRKLARVAPARAAHEGPLAYAERIAAARPDLASQVASLAAHYSRLRYGPTPESSEVAELERSVRALAV
jgi:hypothetical protein